ncbi:MAG: hypothetical protein K2N65_02565 [Anaeroplasmataceae bacterium]|nr:hypothetical protein [Anaeroplasmataceae bacterium]
MRYSKQEIKNSLDCKWLLGHIKFCLIFLGIIIGVSFLVTILVFLSDLNDSKLSLSENLFGCLLVAGIVDGLMICIFLPIIICYLYDYKKVMKLFQTAEPYIVILNQPSTSFFYRGAVYFKLKFTTKNGVTVTVDTQPMWSTYNDYYLEEYNKYNNKEVEILYNETEDRAIVLGLKNKNV